MKGVVKMVGGSTLVAILVAAIVLMVVMISKLKIHPFAALFTVALFMGLASWLSMMETVDTLATGFGNTCRGIGIVILFGTIIGAMLEQSGAALTMADCVLKVVGPVFYT